MNEQEIDGLHALCEVNRAVYDMWSPSEGDDKVVTSWLEQKANLISTGVISSNFPNEVWIGTYKKYGDKIHEKTDWISTVFTFLLFAIFVIPGFIIVFNSHTNDYLGGVGTMFVFSLPIYIWLYKKDNGIKNRIRDERENEVKKINYLFINSVNFNQNITPTQQQKQYHSTTLNIPSQDD